MVSLRNLSAAGLGVALAALACNTLLGIDAPNVRGECVLNSDCTEENYVCLFQVCSPPCLGDEDCAEGFRCLGSGDDTACASAAQAACETQESCPSGTICFGDVCRIDCSQDPALCLRDQVCTSSGVCRGTDPRRDAAPGPAELGAPCDEDGAVACHAFASPARLLCEGGKWEEHEPCGDGTLCDNGPDRRGECAEVPEECRGREPNEAFCDGATRKVCGADLVTVDQAICDSPQHCSLATGVSCAGCLPNEFRCDGETLRKCDETLSGFVDERVCSDPDQPCSASAGDCTDNACREGQRRCAGDVLEVCNGDLSGFEELESCDEGLCDPVGLECDVCVAGTAVCEGAASRRLCSDDGSSSTLEDCDVGTCSGPAGSAICACPTAPADCSGAGAVCRSGDLALCELDGNGCLVTSSSEGCPSPRTCTGTFPNAACSCPSVPQCNASDEINGSYCSGNSVVTCTEGPASCQQVSTTACADVATERCVGSHPDASCELAFGDGVASAEEVNLPALYLYAVPVSVTTTITVDRVGFLGRGTGDVMMAVYADQSGAPGTLVFSGPSGPITQPRSEYPLPSTPTLPAGTYWIALVAQNPVYFQKLPASAAPRALRNMTESVWPPSLPASFGSTTPTNQELPKFYVVGTPD